MDLSLQLSRAKQNLLQVRYHRGTGTNKDYNKKKSVLATAIFTTEQNSERGNSLGFLERPLLAMHKQQGDEGCPFLLFPPLPFSLLPNEGDNSSAVRSLRQNNFPRDLWSQSLLSTPCHLIYSLLPEASPSNCSLSLKPRIDPSLCVCAITSLFGPSLRIYLQRPSSFVEAATMALNKLLLAFVLVAASTVAADDGGVLFFPFLLLFFFCLAISFFLVCLSAFCVNNVLYQPKDLGCSLPYPAHMTISRICLLLRAFD